jgi:hypothetical protein
VPAGTWLELGLLTPGENGTLCGARINRQSGKVDLDRSRLLQKLRQKRTDMSEDTRAEKVDNKNAKPLDPDAMYQELEKKITDSGA